MWGFPLGNERSWNSECNKVGSYSEPHKIFLHNTANQSRSPRSFARAEHRMPAALKDSIDSYVQKFRITSSTVVVQGEVRAAAPAAGGSYHYAA